MMPRAPEKLLIVRLSALGDVVQTLPVLTWIREVWPDTQIGWLVESAASDLLRGNPGVDFLHVCPRKRWMRSLANPLKWPQVLAEVRGFLDEIRREGYTLSLDMQGLLKSAIWPWLAGISRRVGFAQSREGASLFYNQRVPLDWDFFDPKTPISHNFSTLLSAVGLPMSWPLSSACILPEASPEASASWQSFKALTPDPNQPWVVFAPATQWVSKHWPKAHWVELASQVLTHSSANILWVATAVEGPKVAEILKQIPPELAAGRMVDACGQTDLKALMAIFQDAAVVVGSDSAVIHLAGATGRPHVIGLYGPTSYTRTPPPAQPDKLSLLTTDQSLLCQPCDTTRCRLGTDECMQLLQPMVVFSTLQAVLKAKAWF